MFPIRRLTAILAAVLICFAVAGRADAQITDEEAACRATISKASAKAIKGINKGFIGCHKLRDNGDIGSEIYCNDLSAASAATGGKAIAALNAPLTVINEDCAAAPTVFSQYLSCPAPYGFIDDGGADGIDATAELGLCFYFHEAEHLQKLYALTMGSPTGLTADEIKCHSAIGKSVGKIVNTIVKTRAKCQTALDKDGGPLSFQCATADVKSKIVTTITKAQESIVKACGASGLAAAVGSCRGDASGISECVAAAATSTGGGLTSMLWELPGLCPAGARITTVPGLDATDHDYGWKGYSSDADPASGYPLAMLEATTCDSDCSNCSAVGSADPDACRCNGDASVDCSVNADCAGFGGTCQCFASPPLHYNMGGTPLCVMNRIQGAISGTYDLTGNMTLSMATRQSLYFGVGQQQPCPICSAGLCDSGERDGLACEVDATDPTFGSVSYDCPPLLAATLTGANGFPVPMNLTTGAFSLPFNVPCDAPNGAQNCACSSCSLDNSIPCNSDAECSGVGAGVCRTDGAHGGYARDQNTCSDDICTADASPFAMEGSCLATEDKYCDGLVRQDGTGVIACGNDADCAALTGVCPGHPAECGFCTITEKRDCFLNPISANGTPGSAMVGGGCIPASVNGAVNSLYGLPGPFRIRQSVLISYLCDDNQTTFEAPGGSNCP